MGELSEVEGGDERSKLRNSLIVFLKSVSSLSLITQWTYHTTQWQQVSTHQSLRLTLYPRLSDMLLISNTIRMCRTDGQISIGPSFLSLIAPTNNRIVRPREPGKRLVNDL